MNKKDFGAIFLSIACISGCATQYQSQGFSGGFSETQLSENIWRVSFQGNGFTSGERASDFALLRAAELSLKSGYKFFGIADSRDASTVAALTTPVTANTTFSANRMGNSVYGTSQTSFSGGNTSFIFKPGVTNTVVAFKEKPENISAVIYEASFVARSIATKYSIELEL
jgi:hypothetical protein